MALLYIPSAETDLTQVQSTVTGSLIQNNQEAKTASGGERAPTPLERFASVHFDGVVSILQTANEVDSHLVPDAEC